MQEELDVTTLKYVLYARKSTDDPQRQVRSIPDQITECKLLAERHKLNIIGKPLREKKSAKNQINGRFFTRCSRTSEKVSTTRFYAVTRID